MVQVLCFPPPQTPPPQCDAHYAPTSTPPHIPSPIHHPPQHRPHMHSHPMRHTPTPAVITALGGRLVTRCTAVRVRPPTVRPKLRTAPARPAHGPGTGNHQTPPTDPFGVLLTLGASPPAFTIGQKEHLESSTTARICQSQISELGPGRCWGSRMRVLSTNSHGKSALATAWRRRVGADRGFGSAAQRKAVSAPKLLQLPGHVDMAAGTVTERVGSGADVDHDQRVDAHAVVGPPLDRSRAGDRGSSHTPSPTPTSTRSPRF